MTLEEKIQRKVAEQQEILRKAKSENRELTAEEKAKFDELQKGIDTLTAQSAETGQQDPDQHQDRGAGDDTSADPDAAAQRAVAAERQRTAEITDLCRSFDIDPDEYIRNGSTIEETRKAVLDVLSRQQAPVRTGITVTRDERDKYVDAASDAMLIASDIPVEHPAEGAREMAGMSIRTIAQECLEREGVKGAYRMDADAILEEVSNRQYFNPTGAFPSILDQTVQKAYVAGYNNAPATFEAFTSTGRLKDFKPSRSEYTPGAAGDLLLVPEGGELKHDAPEDYKRPTRQLGTYGRQFTMSRQAFINDDIGYITTIPARYAAAARRTINKQVYQLMMGKGKIYDGSELFCKAHKNLIGTGTKPTIESINAAILAMSLQKDQDGNAITIRPATIVCPVGYGNDVYAALHSTTVNTTENTQAANALNRFENIKVVEDAEVNVEAGDGACPWFVIANPMDAKFIEVDYLNGQKIPTIRRSEVPGQLGFVWDVYLDWAVTAIDYRGGVKNTGVTIANPAV